MTVTLSTTPEERQARVLEAARRVVLDAGIQLPLAENTGVRATAGDYRLPSGRYVRVRVDSSLIELRIVDGKGEEGPEPRVSVEYPDPHSAAWMTRLSSLSGESFQLGATYGGGVRTSSGSRTLSPAEARATAETLSVAADWAEELRKAVLPEFEAACAEARAQEARWKLEAGATAAETRRITRQLRELISGDETAFRRTGIAEENYSGLPVRLTLTDGKQIRGGATFVAEDGSSVDVYHVRKGETETVDLRRLQLVEIRAGRSYERVVERREGADLRVAVEDRSGEAARGADGSVILLGDRVCWHQDGHPLPEVTGRVVSIVAQDPPEEDLDVLVEWTDLSRTWADGGDLYPIS